LEVLVWLKEGTHAESVDEAEDQEEGQYIPGLRSRHMWPLVNLGLHIDGTSF
jgi:hypothetical protein